MATPLNSEDLKNLKVGMKVLFLLVHLPHDHLEPINNRVDKVRLRKLEPQNVSDVLQAPSIDLNEFIAFSIPLHSQSRSLFSFIRINRILLYPCQLFM